MKCPHCLISFHESWTGIDLGKDGTGHWTLSRTLCPGCNRFIIILNEAHVAASGLNPVRSDNTIMAWPRGMARAPVSPDVPASFVDDYKEACLVFDGSPKASAALSRRCLQHLLREKAGVKRGDLADEIQQVLDAKSLPSYLAAAIDAVRQI